MVAVVQLQCLQTMMIRISQKHFHDPEQTPIKTLQIITNSIFSGCTTNLVAICAILLHCVAHKVNLLNQMQAHQPTNIIILPIKQYVSTPKRMHLTTTSMIIWEEADANDF